MNDNDKLKIVKRINNLDNNYTQNEIYNIINNYTKNYTINNNGLFISVNELEDNILNKITKLLDYTEYTHNILKENYIEINNNNDNNVYNIDNTIIKYNKNNKCNYKNINIIENNKLDLNYPYDLLLKKCKK